MIQLTPEDAIRLRNALVAERQARDALEIETMSHRLALLRASSVRAALFDDLGDAYRFDTSTPFDFDWVAATLTPKPPQGAAHHGPTPPVTG